MKTTKFFLMAALALTFAACSNDDNDAAQPAKAKGIPFTATISIGDGATTRALTKDGSKLVASWAEGEKVALIHNSVSDEMTVSAVNNGVATITGTITGSPSNGDAVTVIYPSTAADGTTGNVKADLLYAQEGGTLPDVASKYDVRKGTGTLKVVSDKASLDGNVSLANQFAIFKFTTKNADGSATIDVKPLTVTIGAQAYVITPSDATSELYAALPEVSSQTVSFTATGSDSKTYAFSKNNVSFTKGKFYQSTLQMTKQASAPEGAISGVFTVGMDGTTPVKVYFSKGNLKYNGTTWSFFDNQYDYYTSYSADAWDKFGWSTSATNYGMSTATSSSSYSGDFVDWGSNSALQSALGTGWRTLSKDEWVYLFNTRTVNNGQGNGKSYTLGQKVNNVLGVVLYPDGYTGSTYSGSDWSTFESAGCVFLPAAGGRTGTSVRRVGSFGRYWSSTANGTDDAYNVNFDSGGVSPATYDDRLNGFSVRLVRPVE